MACRLGYIYIVSSCLLVTQAIAARDHAEPRCHSMYDYDRKMLRDMHNMDLEIQELKKEIQAVKANSEEQLSLAKAGKRTEFSLY